MPNNDPIPDGATLEIKPWRLTHRPAPDAHWRTADGWLILPSELSFHSLSALWRAEQRIQFLEDANAELTDALAESDLADHD